MIKGERETLDAFRSMQISVRNFIPQMSKHDLEGVDVECIAVKGKKCNSRCSNYTEILSTKITFGLMMKEIESGGEYSVKNVANTLSKRKNEQIKLGILNGSRCFQRK